MTRVGLAPAPATVHLVAGLNGAGKSTRARRLEQECPAVRFTLDEWMLRLYELPYDAPDYPELAARCQHVIWTVPLECAVARVERRAREGDASAHVLGAEAVRHLARLFGTPTADEGIELRVVEE